METLLLTWTISPWISTLWQSIDNTLDSSLRYKQYFSWLSYYITVSNFDNIIFCDNSLYPIPEWDKDLLNNLALKSWKNLELLSFQWDIEAVKKYHYWYGEAEIIDYAFDNSKLLKESKTWFKITWRYIYPYINNVIIDLKENERYFLNWLHYLQFFQVQTAFFKINNELYKEKIYWKTKIFFDEYENNIIGLEALWYYLLKEKIIQGGNWKTKLIQYATIHINKINIILYLYKYIWILEFWKIMKFVDFILFKKTLLYKLIRNKWK
jgi:hypothetical protein